MRYACELRGTIDRGLDHRVRRSCCALPGKGGDLKRTFVTSAVALDDLSRDQSASAGLSPRRSPIPCFDPQEHACAGKSSWLAPRAVATASGSSGCMTTRSLKAPSGFHPRQFLIRRQPTDLRALRILDGSSGWRYVTNGGMRTTKRRSRKASAETLTLGSCQSRRLGDRAHRQGFVGIHRWIHEKRVCVLRTLRRYWRERCSANCCCRLVLDGQRFDVSFRMPRRRGSPRCEVNATIRSTEVKGLDASSRTFWVPSQSSKTSR